MAVSRCSSAAGVRVLASEALARELQEQLAVVLETGARQLAEQGVHLIAQLQMVALARLGRGLLGEEAAAQPLDLDPRRLLTARSPQQGEECADHRAREQRQPVRPGHARPLASSQASRSSARCK